MTGVQTCALPIYEVGEDPFIKEPLLNTDIDKYILISPTGQITVVKRKLFPGYVLIHMIMNDDTWYVVRNTRGVTGFVGPGSEPVPLTEEEMDAMGIMEPEMIFDLKDGDTVIVTDGAWVNTVGVAQDIDLEKQTLTVLVDLFGRETPVELNFKEVKKM